MVRYLALDSIDIPPTRQRKLFDPVALLELSDSIQNPAIGLLHPVVVRRDGDRMVLVAGERRLRAFADSHDLGVLAYHAGRPVEAGKIPAIDIGEMDPLDAWEAELEENIRRADLTWQERANATAQLMDLRSRQAEAKGERAPTVADIAKEVRGDAASPSTAQVATRQEIVLAKHLDDPEIAKAASPKKAIEILRRREDKARHEKLATEVGRTHISDRHKVNLADSEEWSKNEPAESFDVILTDPPYGMDADTFGDSDGRAFRDGDHAYADSAEAFLNILKWFPAATYRLAKPKAHAYIFCDIAWFGEIKRAMEAAGWKVFRTPLIWHKPTGFRTPWVDRGPQRRYEMILFAAKGDKMVKKIGGDVLTHQMDEHVGHVAARKPVSLLVDILSRSVIPGDQVLDLFGGSGSTALAANLLLCHATLVERDPAAYGLSVQRIKELK